MGGYFEPYSKASVSETYWTTCPACLKSTNYKPSQTLLPAKIHSISTSENLGLLFIFSLCKIAKKRTGVGLTNNYNDFNAYKRFT